MPSYRHLLTADLNFDRIQSRVDAMVMLGVPYGDAVTDAPSLARAQAERIAASIVQGGGESGYESKEIVAMIAYMQRLGRDVQSPPLSEVTSSTAPTPGPLSAGPKATTDSLPAKGGSSGGTRGGAR